jgi:hypothetical protein
LDMCLESQIGNTVREIPPSWRISMIQNLSISVLFPGCGTAQLFPAEHSVPLDKNINGAYRLQFADVNREAEAQGNSFISCWNLKA